MIEVNKNTLAGAFGALGKMICRTSPLALCKSIKIEAENRTLCRTALLLAAGKRNRVFHLRRSLVL